MINYLENYMINVNENEDIDIKIIKNFIKDLSFENPQNINENNSVNNSNGKINVNMNVIYKPYNRNNFFSLILKYTFDCSTIDNKKKLFNLELDYFGFFKILETKTYDKDELTKIGIKLLFPYVKEIVEDITRKGGSVPISLNEVDFNLVEN